MIRVSIVAFVLSFLFISSLYAAEPIVLIQHDGQYQGYFSKPRLSDVVSPVNKSSELYWPAASLYSLDTNELVKLEARKQVLLKELSKLKSYYIAEEEHELASSIAKLESDVNSLRLAKKILLPLDPDRVRAKKSLNPLIDPGHYLLSVTIRPEQILLFGLVEQRDTSLLTARSLNAYLDKLTLLVGASSSFTYLILPSAAPLIAKTGLWNSSYQAVPPGASLFIPIEKRNLPKQFENINEQIVELLVNKVAM
jgi:hypothetical protein